MDKEQCVGLWDCSETKEYKPLRRPNTSSNVFTKIDAENKSIPTTPVNIDPPKEEFKSTDFKDIVNNSRLSADAKEWFPSSYSPAPATVVPVHSAQNRLQKIRIDNLSLENQITDGNETKISFDPINLDILIQSLIYDPGQFDNLIENFVTDLEPYFDDIEVAIKTAECIFDYALKEASFRYNAARLCCVLDEHYPFFRSELHILCLKELDSNKQCQGLTLFLAELYMQLHYEAIYGKCLLDSLRNLIIAKTPEDIKSACQALKLTGYSLESNYREELDDIFKKLESLKPSLQQPLINLLESVHSLRRNNWGRSTPPGTDSQNSQEQNGVISTSCDEEYVLYGPDGQEISLEEQEFLCSNFDDADYLGDESSDPDDLYNPEPEMDKEIQEAFREFVKMSKR